MASVELDTASWPVCEIYVEGEIATADVDRFYEFFGDIDRLWAERQEKAVVVVDISQITAFSSTCRKYYAEKAKADRVTIARSVIALCVATPSRLVRGFFTAIRWLQMDVIPSHAFASRDDALRSAWRFVREVGPA